MLNQSINQYFYLSVDGFSFSQTNWRPCEGGEVRAGREWGDECSRVGGWMDG